MWSNFNKKATQLGIVRGSFCRRIWWSGRSHEDMPSVKNNTHKSHYLNFPVPKKMSFHVLNIKFVITGKIFTTIVMCLPFKPFNPWEWLASNFSSQYHPWIKCRGHKNKGNDHQFKKFLIVKQILLVSIIRNVKRTLWRIWIPMS